MLDLGSSWSKVWHCAIPVIAQVHGNCLAGGTDLALHCDLVVASDDARIGFPPVRSMGVPPTNMWLYHVGPQWTKRLLFTGDTVSGTEAAAIGLVLTAVPESELDGHGARVGRADRPGRPGTADRQQAGHQRGRRAHGPLPAAALRRSQRRRSPPITSRPGNSPPGPGQIGLKQATRERDAPFDRAATRRPADEAGAGGLNRRRHTRSVDYRPCPSHPHSPDRSGPGLGRPTRPPALGNRARRPAGR